MTCSHPDPGAGPRALDAEASGGPFEELREYREILRHMRRALNPPALALATERQILALATHGHSPPSLARVTGGWIALVGLAAAMACGAAFLASHSSVWLGALRRTPGELGLIAGAAALVAAIASPALVILGNPRLAERSTI